jgi:type IV secretory pathway TraG/TraD family ATPase VirD4
MATIINNSTFLFDDRIGTDMKTSGAIPFEKMHEEIITVFVVLPSGQLRNQAKWLRIFVNMALGCLFRSAPRVASLPPVLFMLDEFGNLGRLPEIINAMNISRDYRFQLWMFLQYYTQLEKLYPDEWPAFFAGSGAVTTFATGDLETAKHFSELFGKREVEMISTSKGGGNMLTGFLHPTQVQLSESRSTHVFPYIEPEDLGRLGKGETRSRIDPCPWPIEGEALGYWDVLSDAQLKELDPNPYYLG